MSEFIGSCFVLELGKRMGETDWSRSMPRYENFRNALFFLSSAASSAFCTENSISRKNVFIMASAVVEQQGKDIRIRCQP